jgi:hypothetical protein
MSTELGTKRTRNIIGHDNSSLVNWIHVGVIAPGLVPSPSPLPPCLTFVLDGSYMVPPRSPRSCYQAALAYRPQYVKFMPWVGGAVAIIHGTPRSV